MIKPEHERSAVASETPDTHTGVNKALAYRYKRNWRAFLNTVHLLAPPTIRDRYALVPSVRWCFCLFVTPGGFNSCVWAGNEQTLLDFGASGLDLRTAGWDLGSVPLSSWSHTETLDEDLHDRWLRKDLGFRLMTHHRSHLHFSSTSVLLVPNRFNFHSNNQK